MSSGVTLLFKMSLRKFGSLGESFAKSNKSLESCKKDLSWEVSVHSPSYAKYKYQYLSWGQPNGWNLLRKFCVITSFFFSIWVFFHNHSRITGMQGKGEGISLSPLYHFHPLHRHLDISQVITAESSTLHRATSRTRTGNLWFPSANR